MVWLRVFEVRRSGSSAVSGLNGNCLLTENHTHRLGQPRVYVESIMLISETWQHGRDLTAAIQQLLASPSFHRAVHSFYRGIRRIREGKPLEEMGGTNQDSTTLGRQLRVDGMTIIADAGINRDGSLLHEALFRRAQAAAQRRAT